MRRKFLLCTSALAAMLVSTAAFAQSAAPPPPDADENQHNDIIVTAKQRAQSLHDVPLSITALDAEAIAARGIEDIRDLSAFTPGLTFHSNSGRKDLSALAIRGLAPNTVAVQLQGVSSFYDGIYTGGSINLIPFIAVERVEVLKGPQSTTYGRATYSGAIDYIIKTPKSDRITGSLKAEVSHNSGAEQANYDLTADLTLPIVKDALWVQGVVSKNAEGALFKAPTTGIDIGREETTSYALIVNAQPTPDFSVKVFGFLDKIDDAPAAVHMQHPQEWRAAGLQLGGSVTPGAVWLDDDVPAPIWGSTECISTRVFFRQDCGSSTTRKFLGAVVSYDLGGYELSYRGGYYYEDSTNKYDTTSRGAAGGVDPFFGAATAALLRKSTTGISQFTTLEGWSHQLRILSPGDRAFRWRAGAYYFKEESNGQSETYLTATNPTGIAGGTEGVKDIALFGAAAYDFTSALTVELEGRYQEETVSLGACTICTASIANPIDRQAIDKTFLPRATVSWRAADGLNLYALYSYGTKSGRYNNTSNVNFRYTEPERLDNYEVGAKLVAMGGALAINSAFFIERVADQQFVARDPVNTSISYSQNIGKSNIWGFEMDGALRISSSLTASGTLSYAKHEYASFAIPSIPGAAVSEILNGQSLLGKTSVNVPRWNASASLAYSSELGRVPFDLRADLTYRGESFADVANRATLAPVTRLNLAGSFDLGALTLRVFARDVFDNDKPLGAASSPTSCVYGIGLPASFVTASAINNQRCMAVIIPRGREIGASVSFSF